MSINPAIEYCNKVVNKEIPAPKYVKKQCKEFLNIVKGKSSKYFLDIKEVQLIENATKLMNMASGLAVGKTVYESLVGFQWFFIIAILCVKHKNNPEKRRYESATLLISRKNGKTFLIAVIFTILLIIEPKFSEFYSVAADGELSRIVKKELDQLIVSSPLIDKHFKIKRDVVECQLTKSMYKPLNYSNNRLDGRKSNVWLADEVGALPERYAISAMKSSQINMLNRLGIMIDRQYRHRLAALTAGIVTFTNEKNIFGQRTIRISNGVDFDHIPLRTKTCETTHSKEIHLIVVAEVHYWHGIDRLIAGIGEYINAKEQTLKPYFHIIGGVAPSEMNGSIHAPGFKELIDKYNIAEYIHFHGLKYGEELNDLFNKCDFAIGSLGRHRSGIDKIKTLKNREYAARGIPFAYSETDEDFENMPYVFKVPAD